MKTQATPPPVASRIYGITSVALYESIVTGTKEYQSLVDQLNGLTAVPLSSKKKRYHWPTVANAALATTIRGLSPTLSQAALDAVNNLEQRLMSQHQKGVAKSVHRRSVAHGQAVAAAILAWAATDGLATTANCPYSAVPAPGAWEPTPPLFAANPLQPCWGLIRPMVLSSDEECDTAGPPWFSTDPTSDFYAAALQVYTVSVNLTDEQERIANYWADGPSATGTPPGHWIAIVSQIARNEDLSLIEAAEAYVRVGIAVHDAFIHCWKTKYATDLQRPVTYINDNLDANWKPYLITPNFPTYTSGHSTQSGAAATVLSNMFGSMSFIDTTHADHGLVPMQAPRTFNSFVEAAAEAAISRLYGGIHFSFDNEDGFTAGQCIGQAVNDRIHFRE
ncbi:MAG: vanadium-dependent haloperoxidase [Deltaproteobacteria bacterium]|nr:vanadium-dependent haloperoxidase [Deltaproteobacteria bacterium]